MKFTAALSVAALVAIVSAVPTKRDDRPSLDCITASKEVYYGGNYGGILSNACLNSINKDATTMWNQRVCVAAAVSQQHIQTLNDLMSCFDPSAPEPADIPALSSSVYASIVSCGSTACAVTEQNLVDLVYGELAALNSSDYPTSAADLESERIQPIFDWAGFSVSQGIPESNFNDWLHFGP